MINFSAAKKIAAGIITAAVFANTAAVPAFAAEEAGAQAESAKVKEYSFSEAMKLAMDENSGLKTLEENLELYQDNLNRSSAIGLGISGFTQLDSKNASAANITSLRGSIKDARYEAEITEKMLEYTIISSMNSIISSKKNIEKLEKQQEVAAIELEITRQKSGLGLVSESELKTAEENYSITALQIESQKDNVELLYDSLGYILGLEPSQEFDIVYEVPEFEKIPASFNIENRVSTALTGDIYIARLKEARKSAEAVDRYTKSGSSAAPGQSERDGVDNLEIAIRRAYAGALSLEAGLAEKEASLSSAQLALDKTKALLSAGSASRLELKKAELAVLTAEYDIQSDKINHSLYVYQLANPYTLIN